MKKVISFASIFMLTLFLFSSFNSSGSKKPDKNKGQEGNPVIYDFYNFALSGYGGCTYSIKVTVNFSTGHGIRQAIHTNTMNPEDSWHLVIPKAQHEIVVNETVRIIGSNIDETFQLRSVQWFPNQSCHSPSGGSGTLGTNWIPWSNNYFEFGEDMLLNGEFVSQSE